MRRLSSYFFRVATVSALVAVATAFVCTLAIDAIAYARFEAGLPAPLRAELAGEGPDISVELMTALNDYYASPLQGAVLPVSLLLGLLVGGWVGMIHSRRLLRPIEAVAQAAGQLAQGAVSVRVDCPKCGIQEIDAFLNNFNQMAQDIESAERELRDSNAAIAHELRTPLTVMVGRINGMLDGVFAPDEDTLRALLSQTDQLQRIIGDLRLLTLAEAGRLAIEAEPVDLATVVTGADLPDSLTPNQLDLRPSPTRADPHRVRQMLALLLDNALRYGAPEGLLIATGVEDDRAFLRVGDRGPGLSPDQAERAFERFWRAEASRARHSGGSGLGLAVLRKLAQAHGGDAEYADRDGGGALFTVWLPLRAEPTRG